MNEKDRVKSWIHYYGFLQTDNSKFLLFAQLKASPDAADREALRILVAKWLEE